MHSDLLLGMAPLKPQPNFLFLYNNLSIIDLKFTKFRQYLEQRKLDSHYKIHKEDIIYDVLNNETGINIYTSAIYRLTYDAHNNLFQELVNVSFNGNVRHNKLYLTQLLLQIMRDYCRQVALSPRQAYYHLYNLISLNALKAYILEQFAYLARNLNKGIDKILHRTNFRMVKKTRAVKYFLSF